MQAHLVWFGNHYFLYSTITHLCVCAWLLTIISSKCIVYISVGSAPKVNEM